MQPIPLRPPSHKRRSGAPSHSSTRQSPRALPRAPPTPPGTAFGYLAQLATKMMNAYVTAEVLARRHAMGGGAVARVRKRLAVVAAIVGDAAMEDLVTAVVVQAGEAGAVQPGYVPGMFRVP